MAKHVVGRGHVERGIGEGQRLRGVDDLELCLIYEILRRSQAIGVVDSAVRSSIHAHDATADG